MLDNLYQFFFGNKKITENYDQKNDEKFTKNPKDLKHKKDIINYEENVNEYSFSQDMFDIYTSYKNKKQYIVFANPKKASLDIYSLITNQKVTVLKTNNQSIENVKYYINKNNNNEYFISKGYSRTYNGLRIGVVLVWDITNNYKIIFQVEPEEHGGDDSCLLIFPYFKNDIFMVTSSHNKSDYDICYTVVYSLTEKKIIQNIKGSNNIDIFLLLSWYNKNNENYYVLQFSKYGIDIVNLLKKEEYWKIGPYIKGHREETFQTGFIYKKDNVDYLCTLSGYNFLDLFNLHKKFVFKSYKIYDSLSDFDNRCGSFCRCKIIKWSEYVIIYQSEEKILKIFDLKSEKIISNIEISKHEVVNIKKLYHKIYGESLLISSYNGLQLWNIEK